MNATCNQRHWTPVVILAISCILLIGGVSASEFSPWSTQIVAKDGDVGQYSSLALNAAGNPSISFYDKTYGDLKYASWNGSQWDISIVDASKRDGGGGWWYWGWGSNWNHDPVYIKCYHGTERVGEHSSLALDSSGNPRISYYDQSKGDLKYAAWDGSLWIITTVDSPGNVGEYSSLALDRSGNPRISYYDRTHGDLKYASWDGTRWVITTVDYSKRSDPEPRWGWGWGWGNDEDWDYQHYYHGTGKVGEYSSLALDSSGNPRISYHDEANEDLKYASWDGSKWIITTVDGTNYKKGTQKGCNWDNDRHKYEYNTINVGDYSSLALDSSGNPRISYYDETNRNLKYASWDGSRWVITTVDNAKSVGKYSSLELDAQGSPRISYFDDSYDNLKFASWNRTTSKWITEVVDNSKNVGTFTSLALDSKGIPRISYYDQHNRDLKYTAGYGSVQSSVPVVTKISPASGPITGGTVVTVTGTGFTGATTVKFGTKAGTNLVVNSSTKITITSPAGTAGTVDIIVTTPIGTSATSEADRFTYTSAPTVTGLIPANGPVAGGTLVIIAGSGFTTDATVKFGPLAATDVTFVSATNLTAISPSTTEAGVVNVTVTAGGVTSAISDAGQFTYTEPAEPLTVVEITPDSGESGSAVTVTSLTGTGFLSGATVKLTKSDLPDIEATQVVIVSPSQITCVFTLPTTVSAGQWNVVVTNPGGESVTLENGFTVTIAAPTVTAIVPTSGVAGEALTGVSITGTNFISGTTPLVWLSKTGEGNINATEVEVISPTEITCNIQLTPYKSTVPGKWDVVVQNADGQSGTKSAAFSIINPPPTVTSIEPSSGQNGTVIDVIRVVGTNFGFGANPAIWLEKDGEANITASDTQIFGTTELKFRLNIPTTAPAGDWDLYVQSLDGQTGAYLGMFSVTYKEPSKLNWVWSTDGWDGWTTTSSWTPSTSSDTIYGPLVEDDHGIYGTVVSEARRAGSTQSTVTKTFTAASGEQWSMITFNGLLSSSDYATGRSLVITVNGEDVYSATAGSDSTLNGQEFAISKSFEPANVVTVTITSKQSTKISAASYTLQYNSLTLS